MELSRSSLDEARAASLLAWNNSVVKSVDMAVACLIDLATASRSLERPQPTLIPVVMKGRQLKKIDQHEN